MKKIINLGIDLDFDPTLNKQTKLLNIFCVILIFISIFFSFHDYVMGLDIDTSIAHMISVNVMILVLYLNHKNKFILSKIIWLFYTTALCFGVAVFIEPGSFSEYFLLLFPAASLCLFSSNIVGYILIVTNSFLFCFPYYFVPSYPESVIDSFQVSIPIVFSIATVLLVVNFKNQNQKNEKLLQIEKDKILSDKIILQNQKEQLDKLNEFKSHFFVNLSHEIRTPITLIKGYRGQLNFNKHNNYNQDLLKVIDEQLVELTKITDNILDLSKLDENKLELQHQSHSIGLFLEKLHADFSPLFAQKSISFNIQVPKENIEVSFDYDLMVRSVSNIINNALKFTPEKGEFSILTTRVNGDLHLKFSDNGMGIPEKELTKIFDRFYQSKNHITKSKGSGIGLSFTKSILDQHGFNISVENNRPGTTFTIEIPESKLTVFNQKTLLPLLDQSKHALKKTILLVDDHPQMRLYIRSLLDKYSVIEAENGQQALDIIKDQHVDLLITDYMMPVMDGWTLVKNIKKLNYLFPIFVITARVDIKGKLDMLRLGIDNYFTKPFYKDELLYSIEKAVNYHEVLTTESKQPITDTNQITNTDKEKFKTTLNKLLAENYSDLNFGVEQLATKLNISSRTLNRKTKLYFGQTPNQLILETKLLKVKEILDNTPTMPLTRVTKMVGMKNTSYLKKRFKERFDYSSSNQLDDKIIS